VITERQIGLEEKSIFWRIVVEAESFIRGEPATAVREILWTTDGKNPDGTNKFKAIGSKFELLPKSPPED
jgi:hypothetical protein